MSRDDKLPPAPAASSEAARRIMVANRGRDTAPELALRSELHKRGLRFRKHQRPVPGLRCQADLVFPRERVAVFVDGCFWHRCPDHGELPAANREWWRTKLARTWDRDRRNDAALAAAGWHVVRVWEHQPADEAADLVESAVASRR